MQQRYDLHSHSKASDGTLSPAELVCRARAAGITHFALTDHDTLSGIAEAQGQAQALGLGFTSGVEISVSWNKRTLHLLGLGVDANHPGLLQGLDGLLAFRVWRAEEIARRLKRDAGIADALAGAAALAQGDLIGRTHFAQFLVQAGRAKGVREVFKHFLVNGKPGHVPGDWASLEQAIGWIRAAGGQAVLAHPARYSLTRNKLRGLLGQFQELGGAGLEVVSGSHSLDDCQTMAHHARDFALLASAGSDYHGPESPWLELGRLPPLPSICRPIWQDW
ncbi:PHP domain-containing protein [Magnetovirga frankeli]|uniref:PHP domain-containing protein n=1 Tax=Magnetovirga frankeli TaxID=947516 RepID=UPI001293C861|nr:PHP domain-containing protein [gamma proteobacterium SS-5]